MGGTRVGVIAWQEERRGVNAIKRTLLKIRGIDPDEVEEIVGHSREERKCMRREREEAEREARRRYLQTRYRFGRDQQ